MLATSFVTAGGTTTAGPVEPDLRTVHATPCPADPAPGVATCLSRVGGPLSDRAAVAAAWRSSDNKSGDYTPSDLAGLYDLPAGVTSTATVGVIVAGSDPNTQAQLSYYRDYFHLPACTSANRCFREVGQDGSATLPPTDSGWVTETALDVQAVSAICPTCHLLLVDANGPTASDLGAAARTATRLGATYLSLSYGSAPSFLDSSINLADYNDPDVTYVAATGDNGYGTPTFPASASNVVAAGATSATLVNGTWHQSAWSKSGSGCATSLLGGVTNALSHLLSGTVCASGRPVSDISALGDKDTGMMFYQGGRWWSGGGTSLSAPIIAALYALAGNHTSPQAIYDNAASDPSAFVDITSGSTGSCGSVLCNAGPGWDGPSGIGTPSGLAGMTASGEPAVALSKLASEPELRRTGRWPIVLRYQLRDPVTGVVAHARVRFQRSTGHGFRTFRTARTDDGGALVVRVRPRHRTTYRVVFPGDAVHRASISRTVVVRPPHRHPARHRR
jgi:hypothetical protein